MGFYFCFPGVFGFALVVLLGISSLPSVTATLSWKEFAFVQSGLGWTALIFLCAHDMFYGWPYMNGPSCGIPSFIPGDHSVVVLDCLIDLFFLQYALYVTN